MRAILKHELKLKTQEVFPKGQPFEIKVNEDKPTIAILTTAGRGIKIKSAKLYKYFNGFENPWDEINDEMDSSIVPSLTGENVEPDGWDEHGFPSVLLAVGMI